MLNQIYLSGKIEEITRTDSQIILKITEESQMKNTFFCVAKGFIRDHLLLVSGWEAGMRINIAGSLISTQHKSLEHASQVQILITGYEFL